MLLIISFPIWILFGIIFPMIAYGLEHYIKSTCVDSGPHVIYIDCKFYLPDDLYYGGQFSLWMTMKLHNIKPLVNTIQMIYVYPDERFVQLDLHQLSNRDPNNPSFFLHMTDSKKVDDIILNPDDWADVNPNAASTNEHRLVLGIDKNQVDLNNNELSRNQKVEIAMTMTLLNDGNTFTTYCFDADADFECNMKMPKEKLDMSRLASHLRLTVTLQNFPTNSRRIDIRGANDVSGLNLAEMRLAKCATCAFANPTKLQFIGNMVNQASIRSFVESAMQRTSLDFKIAKNKMVPTGFQLYGNEKVYLEINLQK